MRPALLSFALLCCAALCFAQDQQKITAIEQKIAAEKTDSGKAILYHDLFVQYREFDSTKAMDAVNQAISISHNTNYPKGEALYLMNKGIFLNLNGENDAAEALIRQSLDIRKKIGDFAGQGYCLRSLGNIEFDKNDYQQALEYYLQAAPLFEKAGDNRGLAGDYVWIGNVFNQGLKQPVKAAEYFNKSLDLAKRMNDSAMIGYNYNNLGEAYYNSNDQAKALEYYSKSKEIKMLMGDTRGMGAAYSNLCNVYVALKEYKKALLYNDSSLAIRIEQNDKKGMAISYANGGEAHLFLKNYPAAYDNYQKAIQIGNEIDFREAVINSYEGLSKYYEATGNTAEALRYYQLYKNTSDSVYNAGISEQLATMQAKYENGKKEQQLQQQRYELARKNAWLYGSAGAFILLALLGISYYRRFKLKKEQQLQAEVMRQQDIATKAVLEAEENERKRIAGELHDGVGQMMSAARMNLSAFEHDLQLADENQKIKFERIITLVDDSCKEVRAVSHNMMPNALLKSGLANAVREFVDKIDARVLKVDLYSEGLNERIDSNVETVLYRIIQECVNNVIKHSGANHLDISLIKDTAEISVTIEDNGRGFDTSQREKFEGIGLKNIITRVQYLKGNVEWDSTPGRGTLVAVHVPLPA